MAAPSSSEAAQKYEAAAAAAVEACAEDTNGQTCYICMDGAAEEGLVRACACRGHSGVAHVSCLVRQAQVSVQQGLANEENSLVPRLKRWWICRLCEQGHHGAVAAALGWACWKTYVGRPAGDHLRNIALQILADSMHNDPSGRLAILESILDRLKIENERPMDIMYVRSQISKCLARLERNDECLALRRLNYEASLPRHIIVEARDQERQIVLPGREKWLLALAIDLGDSLVTTRDADAVDFCRDLVARAREEYGEESPVYERCLMTYARAMFRATKCSPESLAEAEAIVAATARSWRRRYGDSHPNTRIAEAGVGKIRAKILFNGALAELLAARNCG